MYFCKNNLLNSEDGMEIHLEELPFEFWTALKDAQYKINRNPKWTNLKQGSRLTFQLASLVASDRFDPLAKTNFSLAWCRHFLMYGEQRFSQTCKPNFLVLLFSVLSIIWLMLRRNTIDRNAHECFHSKDTKCWTEVRHDPIETWIASLAACTLDGDNKTNFDDH